MATTKVRLCAVDGCQGKHRARGLCSTHWQREYGAPTRYLITCAWCGAEHMSARKTGYACSAAHRAWVDSYRANGPAVSTVPVRHPARAAEYVNPLRKHWPACRVYFRACVVCGSLFATQNVSMTCGDACADVKRADDKREAKHRRRAMERAAFVAPVVRRHVYARDNYTCQLCGEPLDMSATVPHPLAPTIDHIVALANGGTHEPANVQSAHYRCNAVKGARRHAV